MALPFFALASRFLVNDTSFAHVVSYGGDELPLKYRFAATWAAREGPLLLWVMWMALLAFVWRKPMSGENIETTYPLRLRLVYGFNLLLLLLALNLDPFKESTSAGIGQGLNELLQTDLMVIHPPLIFLAYSLCLHITSISLSSMFADAGGIKDRILSIVRGVVMLFLSFHGFLLQNRMRAQRFRSLKRSHNKKWHSGPLFLLLVVT